MSFTCKAKAEREIFSRGSYRIIAFIPLMDCEELKLNKYLNFSVTGEMPWCEIGREYTLELEEGQTNQYGTSYTVKDVKDLELENIDELDADSSQKILEQFMTKGQAQNCIKAYPEFIKIALKQGINGFDISKIHNVGEVYIKSYVRHLNEKFKYFAVVQKFKRYEVSLSDCTELFTLYPTEEKISEEFEKNPYKIMIDIMGRSFDRTDSILKSVRPELKDSDERGIYMILDVLGRNELDGSTRLNGKRLWRVIKDEYNAPQFLPKLKDLSENSDLIYFDENSGDLSKASTYYAECNVASFIKNKLKNSTKLDIDWTKYKDLGEFSMTDLQAECLKNFCESNVSILCGYSGSGKSASVKGLVKLMESNNMTYVLLSSTGKAARVLSESTGRNASTIHRKCFQGGISEDVVIVDEFGMVALDTMVMLINSIENENSRIVFVGDQAQLSSIGLSKIFSDFIMSNTIPTTMLTEIFRYKSNGSLFVATNVRQGKSFFDDEEMVKHNENIYSIGNNYKFIQTENYEIFNTVLREYKKLLNNGIKQKDIMCLIPYNVGELGSYELNNKIQAEINPPTKDNEDYLERKIGDIKIVFRQNDIVINTKNDYRAVSKASYENMQNDQLLSEDDVSDSVVVNGQTGIIREVVKNGLIIQFDEDMIFMNKHKLNHLLLGYAISTHKSQGSSVDYTISVVSDYHKRMLSRGLLYVADTRCRKSHVDIGSIEAFENALSIVDNDLRSTWLKELLLKEESNEEKSSGR
jgi:exodeoxyribonuclease V alpha subunit